MRMLWNYIGFDSSRMTVQGLARQFAVVFGVFAIIGLSWPYLVRLVSERGRISLAYEDGLDAGDRLLIEYLERSPDATWAWYTLVKQPRPDGRGLDKSELLSRIEACPVLPPVVLRAWYYLYTDGAERALRELDGGGDVRIHLARIRICLANMSLEEALAAAEDAVAAHPDSAKTRAYAIDLLTQFGRFDEARALLDDAAYEVPGIAYAKTRLYLHTGDYVRMSIAVVVYEVSSYPQRAPTVVASLICGLAWLVFVLHMGRVSAWSGGDRGVAVVALLCGFASAIFCLIPICLMEPYFTFPSEDPVYNFIYCVIAIGIKEELVKLLLVVPLLPYLVRQRDRLKILTITSIVGLGFAMNENIGYFLGGGSVVVSRFLTANFFHMVLTGYCGYYLVRAVQGGGGHWNVFALQTLQMSAIHGLYDFLVTMDAVLEGVSLFAMTVYVWLSQVYLRLILESDREVARKLPLTRLFVALMAVVTGIAFVLGTGYLPTRVALENTVLGAVGVGVISIMFFREFKEPVH
jgi:RsiW-degrading membrane proteinase PrsW (M82 family)